MDNKDNVRKLVTTLRLDAAAGDEGAFRQTTGALCARQRDGQGWGPEEYCCLGVATALAAREVSTLRFAFHREGDVGEAAEDQGSVRFAYEVDKHGLPNGGCESGMLHWSVREWLGTQERDPHLVVDEELAVLLAATQPEDQSYTLEVGTSVSMITLNDRYKLTFSEIADVLERQFLTSAQVDEGVKIN